MKKVILGAMVLGLLSTTIYAKKIEQTICFSKASCTKTYTAATIGDGVKICSGKCNGKTLAEMNKDGWKLTEVIGNLNMAFGMVFTREK